MAGECVLRSYEHGRGRRVIMLRRFAERTLVARFAVAVMVVFALPAFS